MYHEKAIGEEKRKERKVHFFSSFSLQKYLSSEDHNQIIIFFLLFVRPEEIIKGELCFG